MQPGENQAECQAWCRPLSMRPPEHRTRSSSDPLATGVKPQTPQELSSLVPFWHRRYQPGRLLAKGKATANHLVAAFFVPRNEKTALLFISSPPPDNWRCKAGFALAPLPYPKIVLFIFFMGCSKCDRCFSISRGSLEAGASGSNGSPGGV